MSEQPTKSWTDEEARFINQNYKGSMYAKTLLLIAREDDVSLPEALQAALAQPDQEEHHDAYRRAALFLEENNNKFNLVLKKKD